MVSFCADIDRLFTEVPFEERSKLAYENGFLSTEFEMPENIALGKLGDIAAYKGLKVSVIKMPEKQVELAFIKELKQDFLEALDDLIYRADFLECKKIYISGLALPEENFEEKRQAFISALHASAQRVKSAGIKILLGFKNPTENPYHYPASTLEVLELLDELNDDRAFGYVFDMYESQSTEGGLSNTIEALISLIDFVRISGVPLNEEPDVGEINYDYLLSLLDSHGYKGHVCASYTPRGKTIDGLKWIKKYV